MLKWQKGVCIIGMTIGMTVGGFLGEQYQTNADNMQMVVNHLTVEVPENALAADVNSSLNIRYEPSTDAVIIGKLYPGQLVNWIADDGNWSEIEVNGQVGYVSSRYVVKQKDLKKYIKKHASLFGISAKQTGKAAAPVYYDRKNMSSDVAEAKMTMKMKKSTWVYASKSSATTLHDSYQTKNKLAVMVTALRLRAKPNTESEIKTVLYRGTTLQLLSAKKGSWYKVKADGQVGYVSSMYVAPVQIKERKSNILQKAKKGQKFEVLDVTENWVSVKLKNQTGYVMRKACSVQVSTNNEDKNVVGWLENNVACTVKQISEDATLVTLENGQQGYVPTESLEATIAISSVKIDQNAVARAEEAIQEQLEKTDGSQTVTTTTATASPQTTLEASMAPVITMPSSIGSGQTASSLRNEMVAYAKQFEGNPYVWGGTSLAEGADCSGFTQQIYAHFGITLNRCSYEQVYNGKEIAFADVKVGDLLFYYNESLGRIGHVALYIGDGKIIHAKSKASGIVISNWNYQAPYKAVNIIGD